MRSVISRGRTGKAEFMGQRKPERISGDMPLVLERLCAVAVRRKEFASRLENRRVRGGTKYKVFDPVDATKYNCKLEHHLLLDPLALLL